MFGRRVELFTLLGFKVSVDMSWALLALLIAWSLAQGFFPELYEGLPRSTYWWMAVAGVIGLFFSIVAHELSHSVVARRYGLPIRGITLFMFGGVAEMEEEPSSPRAELLMAIAGPIASLVLAAAFFLLSAGGAALDWPQAVRAVLDYLAFLNLLLAAFNVVPAFPLDGGRVLRAALWLRGGDIYRATRIASRIGAGFALLLIALGIASTVAGDLVTGMWWFLIGLFLRGAAIGAWRQLEARRAFGGEAVRRFMTPAPVTVPPDITVQELVDAYVYRYRHDFFPVAAGARLLGCVSLSEIRNVPRERWALVAVADIASPCSEANTIEADEPAVRALARMQGSGGSRLMVTERGRLVGVLVLKDMLDLLALKMNLEGGG